MNDNEKLIPDMNNDYSDVNPATDCKEKKSDTVPYTDIDNLSIQPDSETTTQETDEKCAERDVTSNDDALSSFTNNSCSSHSTEDESVAQPVNNQPVVNDSPRQNYYQQPSQQPYYAPMHETTVPTKKKSKGKALFFAVAGILLVCVVGLFSIILASDTNGNNSKTGLSDVPFVTAVSSADSKAEGLSAAEVYQKVFKSSVSVLAYKQSSGELGVLGSGVICQEDTENNYTYIVTCAHVINDSNYNIKVEIWDGSVHSAEVVNFDDSNDIGVIRISGTGFEIAEFGNSDEIQPGATVYAIGSPYSSKFAGSFTRGMVSAVNRLVTTQTSYQLCCIQHDAPINHGNSGGALVNAYGQIIGINALKITAEGYEGLGFSVPSTTVIKVINSIIETGVAPKAPKLGISYVQAIYYSQFLSDFIEENNLPAGSIVIADITEDSSLYNSELKINDIVTAVNGEALTTPDLLVELIQNSNVGDSFELTVVRIIMNQDGSDYSDTQTFTVTATLVEKKDSDKAESNDAQEDFYEYFGDDSGNYEDFYEYFYDYFYGNGNDSFNNDGATDDDNRFTIPE